MINPYRVGDTVLAARDEDGQNHEEAQVVDVYSLIIGEEERPMVCVLFPDGQRSYLRSDSANVLAPPEPEVEPGPGEEEAAG